MRFTFIFGIAGILYAIVWHQQVFIPPTDIFIPIATGALFDILFILSFSKHLNVKVEVEDEEIGKVSNEDIEQELENYSKRD
ncbi:hypothetical protein [Sporosarcina limicola]|uniref:Uncharacterized protein n=1 Tax=Sporosarcina limicola TaxID=34101 RepID=A0A927R2E4_9BACL|nr:hypothetical protein [Sporosarcina limicola]MBE1553831.1 hypothetical protein [Sporosarcina limicola]